MTLGNLENEMEEVHKREAQLLEILAIKTLK